MRSDILKFAISNEVFAIEPNILQKAIEFLDNNAPHSISVEQVASNSVTYEEKDSLAIISIEGAMYKKSMSGLCMSVASYPDIIKAIDKAESNKLIKSILFRVDTPGGAVAGLDELEERIYTSPLKTYTLYENLGASAGIYAFTASDEIYAASKNTELGSIGTIISTYLDKESENKKITIVSQNAPNKVFNLNEDGIAKLQEKLNQYEENFMQIVEKNTGFNKEKIISVFNSGDTIFAEKALEENFISGIMSFNELTNKLVAKAVPTSVNSNKPANNIKKEKSMEISKKDILASAEYLELQASHKAEVEKLTASHTDAIAQAVLSTKEETEKQFRGMAKEVIAMSLDKGLSKDLAVSLMDATDLVSAKAMLVDSMTSEGAIGGKQESKPETDTIQAKASAHGIYIAKKGDK